jgi:hypothetical protein
MFLSHNTHLLLDANAIASVTVNPKSSAATGYRQLLMQLGTMTPKNAFPFHQSGGLSCIWVLAHSNHAGGDDDITSDEPACFRGRRRDTETQKDLR